MSKIRGANVPCYPPDVRGYNWILRITVYNVYNYVYIRISIGYSDSSLIIVYYSLFIVMNVFLEILCA